MYEDVQVGCDLADNQKYYQKYYTGDSCGRDDDDDDGGGDDDD